MKLSVLALDYDGTIARHDVLDPAVREAIADVRAQGIAVMLVSGRILDDLRRVAGDLHFVDGVIAENGAVIEFPASGYSTIMGDAPPPALLDALQSEGIPYDSGRVVVEANATDATRILGIVRRLELPLLRLSDASTRRRVEHPPRTID
jgi:hydroxymethylpyrimidine pyrophosphatase-like HAD family hydrolase